MKKILIRNTVVVALVTLSVSVACSIFGSQISIAAGQKKDEKKPGQTTTTASTNNGSSQDLCKPKCEKDEVCNTQTKKCDPKGPLD